MNTGAIQALGGMLRNVLGLPFGVNRIGRGGDGRGGSGGGTVSGYDILSDDFVNTVVGITADDVCIGNSPVYVTGSGTLKSPELRSRLDLLCSALNGVVRWAAIDLLKVGWSGYVLHTEKDESLGGIVRAVLVPFMVGVGESLSFYMRKDGRVVVYDGNGQELADMLLFLNYSKESMILLDEDSDAVYGSLSDADRLVLRYRIIPEPMQLKNMGSAAEALAGLESDIYQYRHKLARLVRMVTVDVGGSSGDRVQEIIDDISQVVNAGSMSLAGAMGGSDMMFQDMIPVLPNRRGVGKPELITDVPDFDIDKLSDLDHALSKFFLAAQFPKTYADFNTQLDASTVSLLRGDVRYARMVGRCRSLMEDTINGWFKCTKELHESEVEFRLVKLPTTEDLDVSEIVSQFMDTNSGWLDQINAAETRDGAEFILDSLEALLSDTSNLHSIQSWFRVARDYVRRKFDAMDRELSEAESLEAEGDASGFGGSAVDAMVDRAVAAGDSDRAARESAVDARLAGSRERFEAPDVFPSDDVEE